MIPLDLWGKNLHVLDEGAVKRLTRTLWPDRQPAELDEAECLQLSLADWLTHLGLATDAQVIAIVNAVRPQLARLGDGLSRCKPSEAPSFVLAVCDGRWVSCTGRETFFDLQEFEEVPSLPEFAVTHIMCDLSALYFRSLKRLERLRKIQSRGKDAADELAGIDEEMARKESRATTPRTLQEWADGGPESSRPSSPPG